MRLPSFCSTSRAISAHSASGSADAAGLPPAKEIMPGLAIILKISRMALPLIWSKRCAKRRESSAIIQSLLTTFRE